MAEHAKAQTILLAPDPQLVALRVDSVTLLARSGALDAAQIEAALRFRNAFQRVKDAAGESIGFREYQAPGPKPVSVIEERAMAKQDLQAARALLGAYMYALVGRVAGEGHAIRDLFPSRRERDSHHDMLRIGLQQLGALWVKPRY